MTQADIVARTSETVGYQFQNPALVITSLTHSSVADSRVESNERLEFLGDAVLGMVVCEELYRRFSDWLEGDMTKVKSIVVSRRICALIADQIGLTQLLILGNGIGAQNNLPESLKAAVYETVIGAIYLDGGIEPARTFILNTISQHIDHNSSSDQHDNYKSSLQQYAQRHLATTPHYETLDEQGPDHSKCFEVCVLIGRTRFPSAWGPSKKQAEQEAAKKALEQIQSEQSNQHNNETD